MRAPKLLTSYMATSNETLVDFADSIVKQTSASAFYNGNGSRLADALKIALAALVAALDETENPTMAENAQRDELRKAVRVQLGLLAKQLNINYMGQAPALLSSGLSLADATNTPLKLTNELAPTNVSLTDGALPGYVLVNFQRPKGTVVTIIRYTTDPTLPEENWLVATGGARSRALGPFPSGTKVYVKVAGLSGTTTEPDYSAVFTRIVQ